MFASLDFVYVPTADVDATVRAYVEDLGAELVWKVRGMGTTVACLRVSDAGPAVLLSGHLPGTVPVLVHRVDSYASSVEALRSRGVELTELKDGGWKQFRSPAFKNQGTCVSHGRAAAGSQ